MPLLVPEPAVVGRGLEAAEFGAHGGVDQFGQIMRDVDIRAQTKEDIAALAERILLATDPAIAEMSDRADAVVERNSLFAMGLVDAQFDVGQRQVMAIEQFGDLGGGGQRIVLGAAIDDGLGA